MPSSEQTRENIALFSKLLMVSIGITVILVSGLVNLLAAEPGRFFWWFLTIGSVVAVIFSVVCWVFFGIIRGFIREL